MGKTITFTDRQLDLIDQALECFIDAIDPEDYEEKKVRVDLELIRLIIGEE